MGRGAQAVSAPVVGFYGGTWKQEGWHHRPPTATMTATRATARSARWRRDAARFLIAYEEATDPMDMGT